MTTTVQAMLHWLGVKSYSCLRVSDENAFVEKPLPHRLLAGVFIRWLCRSGCGAHLGGALRSLVYEHRYSGICDVPAQRGDDTVLAARHVLYVQARERNPRRWSCNTRDWSPIDTVTLNPEREIAVPTGIKPGAENQRLAA